MAIETAWLIGSYPAMPAQAFTVNAAAASIAAGDYYLYDATAALSLLDQVVSAMTTAGVAGAAAVVCKSRKVKLSAGANFSITWGSATLLRNLLGFTGNISGASSYTATNISPLLWSPGRTENPQMAPLGVRGHKVHSVYQAVSPYSGKTEAASHGYREYNRFTFPYVDVERVRTSTGDNGTYDVWFENVAVPAALWKLYREVSEDSGSTAAADLSQPLGPYVVSAERRGVAWNYDRSRGKEYTDECIDIDIPCHVPPEYET